MTLEHCDGPILNNSYCKQFKKITFQLFSLKISDRDNCCSLKDGTVVLVKNFVVRDGEYCIGIAYKKMQNCYILPCASSELGIYLVDSKNEIELKEWNIKEGDYKCMRLKFSDRSFVVFPLSHLLISH